MLLEEIGRQPAGGDLADAAAAAATASAQAAAREGYALAAGLALGLVTLGHGRVQPGLADLRMEDRLR